MEHFLFKGPFESGHGDDGAMVAEIPGDADLFQRGIGPAIDPGNLDDGAIGPGIDFLAAKAEDRFEEIDAGVADFELSEMHADRDATNTGVEIIAHERPLTSGIETPLSRQGEWGGGDHRALSDDGFEVSREWGGRHEEKITGQQEGNKGGGVETCFTNGDLSGFRDPAQNRPLMSQRPNILFIMCDDHAAQAIGAYGSRINQTPNIDRLANEGMRFDHCYVTNSICTPSRAAILTGTHNHINRVTTLTTHLDNRMPNVAKHLQQGGYQTAIVGKWHLGEGPAHCPTGFDFWQVLPGQGDYYNPTFHTAEGVIQQEGYVTDIITDKSIEWLEERDKEKPFFLMCHHKAPHRPWDPKPEHRKLYTDPIAVPDTFDDDYRNRARAAMEARMRVDRDMTYNDLDLVQPPDADTPKLGTHHRMVPTPENLEGFELRCLVTGERFTFQSHDELRRFKYQRYMQKYLQTVHSVDENVGRLLDYLDANGLAENTLVIYTSDQGFFLGEHGWFDKRFIYEESFQMPFLARYPKEVSAGSVSTDMVSNVDFAQTFLDLAGVVQPNYMQGRSIRPLLQGNSPADWPDLAYHRYWMNQDSIHNAYAHYGIRTHDYKLIYWYNADLEETGAHPGTDRPQWELFDLKKDPMELCNVYDDPDYQAVVKEMTAKLEAEMLRIGDVPCH